MKIHVAEHLDRKSKVSPLAWMAATPMTAATVCPAGEKAEGIVPKLEAADKYPDEIEISTRIVSLTTLFSHGRSAPTSRMVALISIWTMASFAREAAKASSR